MAQQASAGGGRRVKGKRKGKRGTGGVVVNTANTKYAVIGWAARQLGWTCDSDEDGEGWNLLWSDLSVAPQRVLSMKNFAKINHFPGMSGVARKAGLARHLKRMHALFPGEFAFFPRTWALPGEWSDFKRQFRGRRAVSRRTFILKPDASSQGKGIFLTRSLRDVDPREPQVAQHYLSRPLLIDGHKFDVRLYVLVTSCRPLRAYMYTDGLVRVCATRYQPPRAANLRTATMHLTNYAINRGAAGFVPNRGADAAGEGSKRSLRWLLEWLDETGWDSRRVWHDMADVCVKTLVSVQPELAHHYRSCTGPDDDGFSCFEVLGFDVMLDRRMRPWVIEVNHSPSLSMSSPLDRSVKRGVVLDTLRLVNISPLDRKRARARDAVAARARLLGRPAQVGAAALARDRRRAEARRARNEVENLGGFERVFPPADDSHFSPAYYDALLRASHAMFSATGHAVSSALGTTSAAVGAALRLAVKQVAAERAAARPSPRRKGYPEDPEAKDEEEEGEEEDDDEDEGEEEQEEEEEDVDEKDGNGDGSGGSGDQGDVRCETGGERTGIVARGAGTSPRVRDTGAGPAVASHGSGDGTHPPLRAGAAGNRPAAALSSRPHRGGSARVLASTRGREASSRGPAHRSRPRTRSAAPHRPTASPVTPPRPGRGGDSSAGAAPGTPPGALQRPRGSPLRSPLDSARRRRRPAGDGARALSRVAGGAWEAARVAAAASMAAPASPPSAPATTAPVPATDCAALPVAPAPRRLTTPRTPRRLAGAEVSAGLRRVSAGVPGARGRHESPSASAVSAGSGHRAVMMQRRAVADAAVASSRGGRRVFAPTVASRPPSATASRPPSATTVARDGGPITSRRLRPWSGAPSRGGRAQAPDHAAAPAHLGHTPDDALRFIQSVFSTSRAHLHTIGQDSARGPTPRLAGRKLSASRVIFGQQLP